VEWVKVWTAPTIYSRQCATANNGGQSVMLLQAARHQTCNYPPAIAPRSATVALAEPKKVAALATAFLPVAIVAKDVEVVHRTQQTLRATQPGVGTACQAPEQIPLSQVGARSCFSRVLSRELMGRRLVHGFCTTRSSWPLCGATLSQQHSSCPPHSGGPMRAKPEGLLST
jgi:hypothetical protein